GNPFFTEELVDALQESEQIQLVDGHWTLADPLVQQLRNAGCLTGHIGQETVSPTAVLSELDLGIPTTIQGIILSRLDRLPEPVKLTVKVASVIGRIFAQDLLIQAHPRRPLEEERYPVQTANANDSLVQSSRVPFAESLAEEIETLLAREFARVEAPAPHPSYIFKHNITQEVVYQTLLTDQRHELHLAVAMALETLLPDGVDALAMHYYNSNLADAAVQAKAVHYLEQAGLRAQHDYANETALSYFNRALALEKRSDWLQTKIDLLHILGWRDEEAAVLQQLNELPDRAIAEVALRWGAYYEALSNYEAAQQHIEAALRHSQQTGDQRAEIRCMSQLGMILARQGDYDGARRQYNTALRIAESDAKFKNEQADLLYGMGSIDRRQGNYQAAQQQLEFALQLNRENDHRPNEAMTLAALGAVAFLLRDYMTAANYYQQALAIRQAIGEREGEAGSLMSLGQVAATEGDYGKTDELVHAALEIFQVVGNRWWQSIGYNTLGIAALDTGRLGAAQQHFQTSLEISRKIGDEAGEAIALLNLGQTFRDQGNLADATKILSQSLQQAQSQGDKDLEAQCWSDLALCWIASADYEQAIEDAEHALTILQEIGLQTALTRDLCTLATAHLNLGNTALAQAFIEQAFAILEECQGEGPDYPQRDYFSCYRIFSELNLINPAEVALQHAHATLQQKSLKISDPTLRSAFLENVAVNRQIIHTASAFSRQR
ncbi:MAG: tetratricopeptide repeat protein, partial [Caldilineaceae bacterium]|nr:tetratricopeptide repeat protein [Caldilineaceae bacterium]